MTRTITATVLALTIGLTSLTATPVQAGNRDIERFAAGALTLFIIGAAIENNKKKRRQIAAQQTSRSNQNPVVRPSYNNRRHDRRISRRLPEECFFRIRTNDGKRGVYGRTCLRETMRRADRLPQACADTIRVRHGRRAQVYGARCLRSNGYFDEFSRRRDTAQRN
jgi:hypothetical protein